MYFSYKLENEEDKKVGEKLTWAANNTAIYQDSI